VFESRPENDPTQRRPDITRARNLLGWEPTVTLAEGLRLLVERSARHELIGRTS
jgi:nucleoside-diphosphate-sugar epimerase